MAAKAPDDKAEQMRLMVAAYDKMGKALKATRPADRLLALPVRLGRALGVGARAGRQPVAHDGRRARPTGGAFTTSSARRPDSPNMRGPATGTIQTCSKWATAS